MENLKKFVKAKNAEGAWVYGEKLDFSGSNIVLLSDNGWQAVIKETVSVFYFINKTGDVYEGDILKFPNGSIGVLIAEGGSPKIGSGEIGNYHATCMTDQNEVSKTMTIGNIHDNPELLTTNQESKW